MNLAAFLEELKLHHVVLTASEDKLRYAGPQQVLTPAILATLKRHKDEILRLLRDGGARATSVPLSANQLALWFLYQQAPASAAYNVAFAATLFSPLDLPALQRSWQYLVERHASLRTVFPSPDGKPVQEIRAADAIRIDQTAVATLPTAAIHQLVVDIYSRPFDLAQGPLWRVHVFQQSAQVHILLLTFHHIICDAWSMWLLVEELQQLYRAARAGEPVALPPLLSQYEDFVHWQTQYLAGAPGTQDWQYWQQQLAGDLAPLALPTDRLRPPVQTFHGATHTFTIAATLTRQLRQVAHSAGATLYMTVLAAFYVLLQGYTGQTDIRLGSPTSGRAQRGFAEVVGTFVNTVVLRADLSGNPRFLDFLQHVRQRVLEALSHEAFPFPVLVQRLQPERDPSRSPIVQVMLTWNKPQHLQELRGGMGHERPGMRRHWGGLELVLFDLPQQEAQFDWELEILEGQETLEVFFKYHTDLFDAASIVHVASHLHHLLEDIARDPQQRLDLLARLSARAQHQVVRHWNHTQVATPHQTCFPQLFAEQVRRTPERLAVAVTHATHVVDHLTYQELQARANRLARLLVLHGVGADTVVALVADRGIDFLTAILAIFTAGGAYLPLDPAYPEPRIRQILAQSAVPLVLTAARYASMLTPVCAGFAPRTAPRVLTLEALCQADASTAELPRRSWPDNLAYVIYTSGSTGTPKGAMVTQAGMVNHLYAKIADLALTCTDKVAQNASQCFDISVWQFLTALLVGGTVYIVDDETAHNPAQLLSLTETAGLTILETVPSLLRMMLAVDADRGPVPLAALRWLIPTGEALPPDVCREWLTQHPTIPLLNAYGPTECSDDVAHYPLHAPPPALAPIPIGCPVANTQLYVLDQQLHPVPIGAAGECLVGGVGVGRGYWRDPRRTAAAFIPDPWSDQPGARLYKTGDLVRYLPDGNLLYLGRLDHQVKIRGFRIELGEIEATLCQLAEVQEAVVTATTEAHGVRRLVAYVVPKPRLGQTGEALSTAALRRFVHATLPEYMVPAAFVILERLLLTPNGKVDRRQLPAPVFEHPDHSVELMPARNDIEQRLVDIWAAVLGVKTVGITENFFALGGDSILSIQVVSRARGAGLRLTPSHIMQYQTIAQLAPMVGSSSAVVAEQGVVRGMLPCTPIQRWFFAHHLVEPQHFNQWVMLTLPADATPHQLRQTIGVLLQQHDALRSRFVQTPQGWQHIIEVPTETVPLQVIDLAALSPGQQRLAFEAQVHALQASLDLSAGRVMALGLVQYGAQAPSCLIWIIHHLVVDGVSWRILLEDFATVYEQCRSGRPVALPPKTTSFKEWASRVQTHASSDKALTTADYWLATLARGGATLPVDHNAARAVNRIATMRHISVWLDSDKTRALLHEVQHAYHTPIQEVLLTALSQTFARWTGEAVFTCMLEGHGREPLFEDVDTSRTVGWFTTMFPVRLEVRDRPGPGEALQVIKEQLRQIPNKGIDFGLLVYGRGHAEHASQLQAHPWPEVRFNYLGQFDSLLSGAAALAFPGEFQGISQSPRQQHSFVLEIDCLIVNGQLRIDWLYSETFHRRETITRCLAEPFLEALDALIEHCLSPEAGGYTPADFPHAHMDEGDLQTLAHLLETL